jgi:hypothetical protein
MLISDTSPSVRRVEHIAQIVEVANVDLAHGGQYKWWHRDRKAIPSTPAEQTLQLRLPFMLEPDRTCRCARKVQYGSSRQMKKLKPVRAANGMGWTCKSSLAVMKHKGSVVAADAKFGVTGYPELLVLAAELAR